VPTFDTTNLTLQQDDDVTTGSFEHTVPSGTDLLIFIGSGWVVGEVDGQLDGIGAVSWNTSEDFTQLTPGDSEAGWGISHNCLWYLANPTAGTYNVAYSGGEGVLDGGMFWAVNLSDVDTGVGSSGIRSSDCTSSNGGSSPIITLNPTTASDDMVLAVWSSEATSNQSATFAGTVSSETERDADSYNQDTAWLSTAEATGSGQTHTFDPDAGGYSAGIGCVIAHAAGGQELTLTAATGAYTYSGTAAAFKSARNLTSTTGAYTYTGTAADLTSKTILTLAADTGSYTYTGTAAEFSPTRNLSADTGSYTYTGTAADFSREVNLDAVTGAYTYTGTEADLTYQSANILSADSGAYTYTGTAAELIYEITVDGDSGAYAYTGTAATLTYAPVSDLSLTADTGAYTYTGTSADLISAKALTAESGSYTYTGTAVELSREINLTAATGAYTYTGTAAALTYSAGAVNLSLTADAGSYTYTGTAADFSRDINLTADTGAYSYTGTAANLTEGGDKVLSADSGTYTYTGAGDNFWLWGDGDEIAWGNEELIPLAGTVDFIRDTYFTAESGAYAYTGTDANLTSTVIKTLQADTGAYTYTGTAAELVSKTVITLAAESGAYALTGTDAAFDYHDADKALAADSGLYVYTGNGAELTQITPIQTFGAYDKTNIIQREVFGIRVPPEPHGLEIKVENSGFNAK